MKDILSMRNRGILAQFSWSNVLVAFDYDGTLSPIVAKPDRAAIRRATQRLLHTVVGLYPVVVISGRAQADVRDRLHGLAVDGVVGNHGIEPWDASDRIRREVRAWRPALEAGLRAFKGVSIEDKAFSVAVHYRRSRQKRLARGAILEVADGLGQVRVVGGKQVVNILPQGAPHKGVALERERDRLGCDTAIYVGDDETDEDVFRLHEPGRLLSIRVGAGRASAADYCIRDQAAIDGLLEALVAFRRGARRKPTG
jgi:trehalose 6-phosphate phosphatase